MQENDFMSQSELMADPKDNGYIYILFNPVYPDCVKIGKTTRLAAYRAAELSKNTSVPKPFKVEWSRYIEYYLSDVEETIH